MKKIDKYRGCLVGGAVGDALGYTVEFMGIDSIIEKYGEWGITEYELKNGVAEISDDTQMTLFTANGLLTGTTRGRMRGIMGSYALYVWHAYKDWMYTQFERYPFKGNTQYTWLANIPELFHSRAPGRTCIDAIMHGEPGTLENLINGSKGCGGIMRVAPVGLYFDCEMIDIEEIDKIGAEVAALTHSHELGYVPAAALTHIVSMLAHESTTIMEAVMDMQASIEAYYGKLDHVDEMLALVEKAVELSRKDIDDKEAIRQIGEGWVAEETLAIAIYCALKYPNDFEKAIIAAVNHSGDSDSTGSVTGNILGAYLGMAAIPQKYIDNLELKDVIIEIADDLYNDCKMSEYGKYRDEIWIQKYMESRYVPGGEPLERCSWRRS